jgi:hypothetical protein
MKFSIFTLLAATGYAAMIAAAIASSDSIWRIWATTAAMCLFAYFVVLAFESQDRGKAAFGRVAAILSVSYLLATVMSQSFDVERRTDLFPHERLTILWYEAQTSGPSNFAATTQVFQVARNTMTPFLAIQSAIAFGTSGGCLALWRYGRNAKAHPIQDGP